MPVTVRVRNFQSIKDATVVIDGFSVVTGANNSGKTALVRAIRGVFTNAPAGPLVRHGEAFLTVDIDFGDGNTVTWEKGWERPGQKGATVNRYTVNGQVLPKVGRGCPDEVLALGMRPISAGSDTLWPQVADQFKGVLFLVGSPGSAVAEAIADVDRVGRLSAALKLSEKDRRAAQSTLKVRRKDEETLTAEVESFDGLDAVADQVDSIEDELREQEMAKDELEELIDLRRRHAEATVAEEVLSPVENIPVPPEELATGAVGLRDDLDEAVALRDRLVASQAALASVEGVSDVGVPDVPSTGDGKQVRDLRAIQTRLESARSAVEVDQEAADVAAGIDLADGKRALDIGVAITSVKSLKTRRDAAVNAIEKCEAEIDDAERELLDAVVEVNELLGGLGECPTCGTRMEAR